MCMGVARLYKTSESGNGTKMSDESDVQLIPGILRTKN